MGFYGCQDAVPVHDKEIGRQDGDHDVDQHGRKAFCHGSRRLHGRGRNLLHYSPHIASQIVSKLGPALLYAVGHKIKQLLHAAGHIPLNTGIESGKVHDKLAQLD